MRKNLERSLVEIFGHEGGYGADPRDPGNWTGGARNKGELLGTKYGISAAAYPRLDIPKLTLAEASRIYERDYWSKIRGDDLPSGVDHATLDPAINSGVSRGARWLQRAVGVSQDGVVGDLTVRAAQRSPDKAEDVREICRYRTGFLRALSSFATYGRGWIIRVTRVEVVGVGWALEESGASPAAIRAENDSQAREAGQLKTASNRAAAASGGGAVAGGGATAEPVASQDLSWAVDAALVVGLAALVVLVGFFLFRAHVQRRRAAEYKKAA